MSLGLAPALPLVVAALAVVACNHRTVPSSVDSSSDDPTSRAELCDQLAGMAATCPSLTLTCPADSAARCMLEHAANFGGYCAIESGGAVCDGTSVSQDYMEYCAFVACAGEGEVTCVTDGQASCSTDPPPDPSTAAVCEDIVAIAGGCPDYGYDCASRPEEQSLCFLEVLELAVQEIGDACFMFEDNQPLCAGGSPSVNAFFSCSLDECFAIATYDDCMANLEILCPAGG